MKISKIESQRKKNRYNIYVDEDFSLGVSDDVIVKYNLYVGMEVDDDFIQDILVSEEENKVLNYALNLLSYRQRSEKELVTSMNRKDYNEQHIEKTITYLKDNNYINDLEFAKSFVYDKINLNKYGPERIKYDLIVKGVSRDIMDEVIVIDRGDQINMAREIAYKKIWSYKNDDKRNIYRKMSSFLQRKGFSYDIISRVVREVIESIEKDDDLNE